MLLLLLHLHGMKILGMCLLSLLMPQLLCLMLKVGDLLVCVVIWWRSMRWPSMGRRWWWWWWWVSSSLVASALTTPLMVLIKPLQQLSSVVNTLRKDLRWWWWSSTHRKGGAGDMDMTYNESRGSLDRMMGLTTGGRRTKDTLVTLSLASGIMCKLW
ncbi:hypothetical protein EDD15DRAFT_2201867 [Pisolithus albus]|nr:hypothetical protein EDD15DRAFT_2201867 [Pisolithus albus]